MLLGAWRALLDRCAAKKAGCARPEVPVHPFADFFAPPATLVWIVAASIVGRVAFARGLRRCTRHGFSATDSGAGAAAISPA
jgi:hypothetical protein